MRSPSSDRGYPSILLHAGASVQPVQRLCHLPSKLCTGLPAPAFLPYSPGENKDLEVSGSLLGASSCTSGLHVAVEAGCVGGPEDPHERQEPGELDSAEEAVEG